MIILKEILFFKIKDKILYKIERYLLQFNVLKSFSLKEIKQKSRPEKHKKLWVEWTKLQIGHSQMKLDID